MKEFNLINKDRSRIGIFLKDFFVITILSVFTFLICDALLTKIYRVRGFSQFFESNKIAGFINKREFVGIFGGPLDDFSNKISIDVYGTRKVIGRKCNFSKRKNQNRNLIFIGDSMVAGFEVKDSEHYVSRLSKKCISKGLIINGGVRAHDTHMASANAVRILKEFNLDQLNTVIVYGVTNNDFHENDHKNTYYNMKAKFGSIFDQKNYKPKANLNYLRVRMFIGDNFYFTTKFIVHFMKLKASFGELSNQNENLKSEKCIRAISILDSTFSSNSIKSKVLLFVHPNFNNLEETKSMENCLISASKNYDQISLLPIHNFMNDNRVEFDYKDLIFKRDFHFTPKGHLFISEIILPKLNSELSKKN